MSGEIILGICPKCSHLYFEQPFPEACPSCGTHTPPMDPEVAAERHKARKEGAQLDPIVAAPTEDSQIGELFHDGLLKLRQLMAEERGLLNKMEDDLTQAKKDPAISLDVRKMIEVKVSDQERRVRALHEAENRISAIVVLKGRDRHKPKSQKFAHHEFISGKNAHARKVDDFKIDAVLDTLKDEYDQYSLSSRGMRGTPPQPWAGGPCPACNGGTIRWETNYLEFKEVLTCPACQQVFNKRSPRHTAPEPLDPLEGGEP